MDSEFLRVPPENMYSIKWKHEGVYRRFQLSEKPKVSLYVDLLTQIKNVVPNFDGILGWKDDEGDLIVFSSESEVVEALSLSKNRFLRIETVAKETEDDPLKKPSHKRDAYFQKEQHPGITCDRCDQPVFGIRYKCVTCDDYDLCEECEKDGAHPDHAMIRYATPRTPMIDIGRFRRYWQRHPRGHHSKRFAHEDLFGAAAAAATQAAHQAAAAAAQNAAQHAAAAAANIFAQNSNETQDDVREDPHQQFRNSVSQGMEYLKEVGAHIQQAFANFGIEVDLDVRHNGVNEKVTQPTEVKNDSPSKDSKSEDSKTQPTELNDSPSNESKNEDGKRKCVDTDCSVQIKKPEEDLSVPLKKMHISADGDGFCGNESESVKESEKTDGPEDTSDIVLDMTDDGTDGWTIMDDNSSQEKTVTEMKNEECMAGTPFIEPPKGPHNPHCNFTDLDEEVALCVTQLEDMGFDNCNGWLTKLSIQCKGDIDKVIESLKSDPIYIARISRH